MCEVGVEDPYRQPVVLEGLDELGVLRVVLVDIVSSAIGEVDVQGHVVVDVVDFPVKFGVASACGEEDDAVDGFEDAIAAGHKSLFGARGLVLEVEVDVVDQAGVGGASGVAGSHGEAGEDGEEWLQGS